MHCEYYYDCATETCFTFTATLTVSVWILLLSPFIKCNIGYKYEYP